VARNTASDFYRFRIESGARCVCGLFIACAHVIAHDPPFLPFVDRRDGVLPVCRWISAETSSRAFSTRRLFSRPGLVLSRTDGRRSEEMSAESDASNNAILRSLLELAGEENAQLTGGIGGVNSENVAQLLAAAIAQVGQSILAGSGQSARGVGGSEGGVATAALDQFSSENLPVNPVSADSTASGDAAVFDLREAYESVPQASTLAITDADVVSTVEVPANGKPRPLCVKFPIELRKQIISMRKSGKLSKDIAKELKVSVSGVQKVWERFLATGMAHDRKPSSYAGRPRKSTYSQEVYSPGFDLQPSDDVFPCKYLPSGSKIFLCLF
jgi:hypothetical protein